MSAASDIFSARELAALTGKQRPSAPRAGCDVDNDMIRQDYEESEYVLCGDTDEIAEKIEAEMKSALHKEIDEIFPQLWRNAQKHANYKFLEWLQSALGESTIEFMVRDGDPLISCQVLAGDWENEADFCVRIPIKHLTKCVHLYASEDLEKIATEFKNAADIITAELESRK